MPSAELGSLDPIQEEIQTKVGHSELRCPGNSEQAAAHCAPAASGDEKHKTKYSAICVQVIIQSLPHAGARDDEVFSARHLETAGLKKGGDNCAPDFLCVMIAAAGGGSGGVSFTCSLFDGFSNSAHHTDSKQKTKT